MQFIQARTGSDLLSESSDLNPKVCGICAHGWPNKTKPMSVTVTCASFGVLRLRKLVVIFACVPQRKHEEACDDYGSSISSLWGNLTHLIVEIIVLCCSFGKLKRVINTMLHLLRSRKA